MGLTTMIVPLALASAQAQATITPPADALVVLVALAMAIILPADSLALVRGTTTIVPRGLVWGQALAMTMIVHLAPTHPT